MSHRQISVSRAVAGVVCALSLIGMCARASAQTLGRFVAGSHVRMASIGLGLSLVAFVLGTLYLRRRVPSNALKYMAMVVMTVSLGYLVAACTYTANDYSLSVSETGLTGGTLTVIDEDAVGVSVSLSSTMMAANLATLPSGTVYNLVLTSPAGQSCTFVNGQTSDSGNVNSLGSNLVITCVAATGFTVTGTVTGLAAGATLGITDTANMANGGNITVSGQTGTTESFTLDQNLASGKAYSVTLSPSSGQFCTITSGVASGTITANVVLGITCSTTAVYPVSVSVTGLPTTSSPTFTVKDTVNTGSVLVTGNGTFTVDAGLVSGKSYTVSFTSPSGESCVFTTPNSGTSASGTIASASVTLAIACSTTPVYSVSVVVTGLPTTTPPTFTVADSVNGTSVTVNGNNTFVVDTGLASGKSYTVSFTSPSGQTCTFTSNSLTSISGTIGSANVTLNIGCSSSSFVPIALSGPGGMAFDAAGHLYVANGNGNEVLIYSESGGNSSAPTLTETGAITNGINGPSRLAFDSAGYLYVANIGNNTVTVYQPSNPNTIMQTISNGITRPLGIAVDQLGNVYVGNNSANSISMYSGNPASGFTLVATYTQDHSGNQFLAPGALMFNAFGGLNDLFIALGPSGSTNGVYEYVAPLSATTGTSGSLTNNSCSTGPSGPTGIATKGYGSSAATTLIYVTNYYAANVTAYTLANFTAGGCPTPVAVSGSSAQISSPEGVAVDAYGNVFVANSSSNTITVYTSITGAPVYVQH